MTGALLGFDQYRNIFPETDGICRPLHANEVATAEGYGHFANCPRREFLPHRGRDIRLAGIPKACQD